jgi:hypothetical protein
MRTFKDRAEKQVRVLVAGHRCCRVEMQRNRFPPLRQDSVILPPNSCSNKTGSLASGFRKRTG